MTRRARQAITLPFMNVLQHAHGATFAVDYYDDVRAADYAHRFEEGWRQLVRQAPGRPRGTPLFFSTCPGCEFAILTSRTPGSERRCRFCNTTHEVRRNEDDALETLRAAVLERIGKRLLDLSGFVQVVLLQPVDDALAHVVADLCEAEAFRALANEHAFAVNLWFEGMRRRLVDPDRPHTAWEKTAAAGAQGYEDEASPDVETLLAVLADFVEVRSISGVYDPRDTSNWGLAQAGASHELEHRLRAELEADPTDAGTLATLVEILIVQEKLDEAREKAHVLTILRPADPASWRALGRVELRAERSAEAAMALERTLELDPTDARSAYFLAHCYERLGDKRLAGMWFARSAALGGPY